MEKDIQIKADKEKGTQLVIFKSSSDEITKEKAVEAIGDKKDRFVVTKVEKAPADYDPSKDAEGKDS